MGVGPLPGPDIVRVANDAFDRVVALEDLLQNFDPARHVELRVGLLGVSRQVMRVHDEAGDDRRFFLRHHGDRHPVVAGSPEPDQLKGDVPEVDRFFPVEALIRQHEGKSLLQVVCTFLACGRPACLGSFGLGAGLVRLKALARDIFLPAPHIDQSLDLGLDLFFLPAIFVDEVFLADNRRSLVGGVASEAIETVDHVDGQEEIVAAE